jgi:hypothetical protein
MVAAKDRVETLGRFAFVAGRCGVLLRYASGNEINLLKGRRLQRLYYVIDDDLFSARTDPILPLDYRDRLTNFSLGVLPRILDIATDIVAPSRAILNAPAYDNHEKSLLDPAYTKLCPDLSHFKSPVQIRCVVLGTRSHLADIASVVPAVLKALAHVPKLTVTTFIGRHAPPEFRDHPRIVNRAPLPWPAFRKILKRERYHIAIAPALPTEFNKARSITRILDHAALGAAGIYSNQAPFSGRIANGRDGILLDPGIRLWSDALIDLANDLGRAESIAAAGRSLAERLGNPERVRHFWNKRLGTEMPRPALHAL